MRMNVSIKDTRTKDTVESIAVGDIFTSTRRKKNGALGVYMKVDKNSGITENLDPFWELAINLETGQLKLFYRETEITKVNNPNLSLTI